MKKVLVTGAHGFIGKNLIAELIQDKELDVLSFGKSDSEKVLIEYIKEADFIFHLAGVNRPKEDFEFEEVNHQLTLKITNILKEKSKKTPILISSSIQSELDNLYGKSKKAAEDVILELANSNGNQVYVYRLPNVFGKWCRPNYNSVVATFCHNIANGEKIVIDDPKIELSLVYIDDVVADFIKCVKGLNKAKAGKIIGIERKFNITLKDLSDKIYFFKNSRLTITLPDFESDFERFLYATYISYLPTGDFEYNLEMKHDDRGWLAEFLKSKQFGQIFISKTKPGITRGNHWHHTKIEKFLVVSGEAEIKFRKIDTDDIITHKVNGDKLRVLDIPVGYTHSITNIGKSDLITIFWADEIFNVDAPDTYFLEV